MKYLILLLAIAMAACNGGDPKTETPGTHEAVQIEGLTLNDGAKWIANPETEQGMQEMKLRITNFSGTGLGDYHTLGNELGDIKNEIIAACDMKGKPHDQLHLVLFPMLDEIKQLQEATSKEEGDNAVHTLEGLLEVYFAHFTT